MTTNPVRRLGYACINHTLSNQKPKVTTNRTMRVATFKKQGLPRVLELIKINLSAVDTILRWNVSQGINFFRLSSDLFPVNHLWDPWSDLDSEIHEQFKNLGKYISDNDIRISMHPGPYNKLCSSDQKVVKKTIRELNIHSYIMDLLFLPRAREAPINIHVGASYGDKVKTADQFIENFYSLDLNLGVRQRLTIENDDLPSLYHTKDLYDLIYNHTAIPIVFDFLHHDCHPVPGMSQKSVLKMALETWPSDITPVCHWSESRQYEAKDKNIMFKAHSNLCYGPVPVYPDLKQYDLMIEAKHKEQSIPLIKYANGQKIHRSN